MVEVEVEEKNIWSQTTVLVQRMDEGGGGSNK